MKTLLIFWACEKVSWLKLGIWKDISRQSLQKKTKSDFSNQNVLDSIVSRPKYISVFGSIRGKKMTQNSGWVITGHMSGTRWFWQFYYIMLCCTLEFWGFTSDWHPQFQIPNSSPAKVLWTFIIQVRIFIVVYKWQRFESPRLGHEIVLSWTF